MLGGYALLYPRARVLTLFFFFFIFFVEMPALLLLGLWIFLQFLPAVGQLATPDVDGGGGVAYFAHIGGFLFGLAAIKLSRNRRSSTHYGPTEVSGLLRALMRQMQTAVLVLVLGFLVLFAAMTFEVISRTGLDILSVLALLFIAMMALPLLAGLFGSRHDDD